MKFAWEFLRNTYVEKNCLYHPQKSLYTILEKYTAEQVESLLISTSLGMEWQKEKVYNYVMNLIKLAVN